MSAPDLLDQNPPETEALATRPVMGDPFVALVERLATNPDVDVAKLEKLIDMQRGIMRDNARGEFFAAFAMMQGEIPEVTERGEIRVNGDLRSKFARNEDIQAVVKPILAKHGFMLSFRTEYPTDKALKVIGMLGHRSGHVEQTEFIADADTSGTKNAIQARGSTISYGMRYCTVALLNIATREDNDGQTHRSPDAPPPPDGYDEWLSDLEAMSLTDGLTALKAAWTKSNIKFRNYITAHQPQRWHAIKTRAEQTGS